MTLLGVDVSTYQVTTPSLSGLSFLFARATYGTSIDVRYQQHITNAHAAGLVVGAYHFARPRSAVLPSAQLAAFLAVVGPLKLVALDVERDGIHGTMSDADATWFITQLKAAGKSVGLYHSASGYPEIGQDFNWIASWTVNPPAHHWDFWQYRGSPLDLDRYAGTLAQLRALAGIALPAQWEVTIRPLPGKKVRYYTRYRVNADRVTSFRRGPTKGFHADSGPPHPVTTASGHAKVSLVQITEGGFAGWWVSAKWAKEIA